MTDAEASSDWRATYADAWGRTVLEVLGTVYPYGSAHVSRGPDDTDVDPVRLHPSFYGSFDWHSSVHMHWSAVRLLTLAADGLESETRTRLVAVLDERLTPASLQTEADYLRDRPSWERPYGWAWAAMLAAVETGQESLADQLDPGRWLDSLTPARLRQAAERYLDLERYVRVTLLPAEKALPGEARWDKARPERAQPARHPQ
jgi:hypothetical protein